MPASVSDDGQGNPGEDLLCQSLEPVDQMHSAEGGKMVLGGWWAAGREGSEGSGEDLEAAAAGGAQHIHDASPRPDL